LSMLDGFILIHLRNGGQSAYRRGRRLFRSSAAKHFDDAGHADIPVTNAQASPAADARHGQFALDEVVRQFSKESAITAIVDRAARVEAARHARETGQRARIPDPHTLGFVWPRLTVAHGEAGARRANVGASATFHAALADFLPRRIQDLILRNISHGGGEPTGGRLESLAYPAKDFPPALDMRRRPLPENRITKQRLSRGCSGDRHEFTRSQVHQLQIEMLARGRAGVGAHAKAILADVLLGIGADDVDQKHVFPTLFIINVPKFPVEVKAIEMPDARHVAGADAKDRA